jgi:hypothetical protein
MRLVGPARVCVFVVLFVCDVTQVNVDILSSEKSAGSEERRRMKAGPFSVPWNYVKKRKARWLTMDGQTALGKYEGRLP